MMSEEQLNELKWRYPFEEQWEHCYFDDKGNLWTPRIIDDVMVKTGEEVYLEELNKPIPQVEPDKIDICLEENKVLKAQVSAMSQMQDFYEECIVEMAQVIYA